MKRFSFIHLGLGAVLLGLAVGTAWALTFSVLPRDGHSEQSRAGSAIAIHDVTGDGVPDLLVGAPAYESGDAPGDGQNTQSPGDQPDGLTGEVLIFKGTAGGDPEEEPHVVLHGEGPGDRFGAAIQVGDVTGDGKPDVIVSAITASGHDAPRTGCVYVFSGADIESAPAMTEIGAHDAVAEVCGSQYREHFGRALAVGEFDDHMGLDIAVGAPWYSGAHSHMDAGHPYEKYLAGAVYLVSSHEIEEVMADPSHEIHAPLTAGEGWTAAYGENLLSMGDIDAASPGVDELLIFATGAENHGHSGKGRAYLATWDPMLHEGEPEGFENPLVVIRGTGTLGSGDPAFLGDLNGDLIPEIGMPSSTGSGTPANGTDTVSAGGLYVVDGDLMSFTPYVPATDTTPEDGVNDLGNVSLAAITGELAQDKFGTSMAALADIDAGGTPDFAVGAPWADGAADVGGITLRNVISGTVYLLSGEDINNADPATKFNFKIRGAVAAPLLGEIPGKSNDRFGEALAVGDLTAATNDDLVVGVPDHDHPPTAPSTLTDVPGTNSNDNRGAVLIESSIAVP
jgi:hypothetical protein